MKNCIIIHGCPSNSEKAQDEKTRTHDKHWMPWLKRELGMKGIVTTVPLMPEPWDPVYEKFKVEFEKLTINDATVLIGHSCGCSFLVRWLGESKKTVDKLILVAPWKIAADVSPKEKDFYEFPIDQSIAERVNEIVIFTSNDEDEDGKEGVKMYHAALGGKIIDLQNHGHYTLGDMGTEEFPELLQIIVS